MHFLAAGFVLSCLGFRFFLSFFCGLLPLPILMPPRVQVRGWLRTSRAVYSIGRTPAAFSPPARIFRLARPLGKLFGSVLGASRFD